MVQQALNPQSDVSNIQPVVTFRQEHARLQDQLKQLQHRLQEVEQAKAQYEPLNNAHQQKTKELAAAETNLKQMARPLGKAAFEGLVAGQVQSQPIFNDRFAVHSRIGELQTEHDRLAPPDDAGMVQKTKAKAQQLVVAGKIKLEQMKVGKLEEQIGSQLIASNQEESVRCGSTADILAELARQRNEIAQRRQECEKAREALDNKKQQLAQALQIASIEGSKSLDTERRNCETQIAEIDKQRSVLEKQLPERLLACGPLDGSLGKLLRDLRDVQAQLDAAPASSYPNWFAKAVGTWRRLDTKRRAIIGASGVIGISLFFCYGMYCFVAESTPKDRRTEAANQAFESGIATSEPAPTFPFEETSGKNDSSSKHQEAPVELTDHLISSAVTTSDSPNEVRLVRTCRVAIPMDLGMIGEHRFSDDGGLLLVPSSNLIIDVVKRKPIDIPNFYDMSPDGHFLAGVEPTSENRGNASFELRVVSIEGMKAFQTIALPKELVSLYHFYPRVSWSPSGDALKICTDYDAFWVVRPSGRHQVSPMLKTRHEVDAPLDGMFSYDGMFFAVVQDAGVLTVYNTDSWEVVFSHRLDLVHGFFSFSPDGEIVAEGRSESVVLRQTGSWRELCTLPNGQSFQQFFEPGVIATKAPSDSEGVTLWDYDGKQIGSHTLTFPGHLQHIESSRDGRLCVGVRSDGQMELWNVLEGRLLCVLGSEDGKDRYRLKISPDGNVLASFCSNDGVLEVWSCEGGEPVSLKQYVSEREKKLKGDDTLVEVGDGLRVRAGTLPRYMRQESLPVSKAAFEKVGIGMRSRQVREVLGGNPQKAGSEMDFEDLVVGDSTFDGIDWKYNYVEMYRGNGGPDSKAIMIYKGDSTDPPLVKKLEVRLK